MNCDEIVSGLILEFRRGTLIMVVLAQLNKPMYGYSLVKELEGKGISIEGNTLYPLLRRLESQGLLKSEWETEATKPRKYYIITEDAKSGYQFFKHVCDKCPEACVSADGKSNIYRMLLSAPYKDSKVLVVADGAAFGCDVERIARLKAFQDRNVKLFLPESFEHLLLRAALFCHRKDVTEILGNPSEYIDASFNSWEQYFTDLLVRLTSRTPAHYTKGKLPNCFIEDCCYIGSPCRLLVRDKKVESVLQLVHDVDFSKLRE